VASKDAALVFSRSAPSTQFWPELATQTLQRTSEVIRLEAGGPVGLAENGRLPLAGELIGAHWVGSTLVVVSGEAAVCSDESATWRYGVVSLSTQEELSVLSVIERSQAPYPLRSLGDSTGRPSCVSRVSGSTLFVACQSEAKESDAGAFLLEVVDVADNGDLSSRGAFEVRGRLSAATGLGVAEGAVLAVLERNDMPGGASGLYAVVFTRAPDGTWSESSAAELGPSKVPGAAAVEGETAWVQTGEAELQLRRLEWGPAGLSAQSAIALPGRVEVLWPTSDGVLALVQGYPDQKAPLSLVSARFDGESLGLVSTAAIGSACARFGSTRSLIRPLSGSADGNLWSVTFEESDPPERAPWSCGENERNVVRLVAVGADGSLSAQGLIEGFTRPLATALSGSSLAVATETDVWTTSLADPSSLPSPERHRVSTQSQGVSGSADLWVSWTRIGPAWPAYELELRKLGADNRSEWLSTVSLSELSVLAGLDPGAFAVRGSAVIVDNWVVVFAIVKSDGVDGDTPASGFESLALVLDASDPSAPSFAGALPLGGELIEPASPYSALGPAPIGFDGPSVVGGLLVATVNTGQGLASVALDLDREGGPVVAGNWLRGNGEYGELRSLGESHSWSRMQVSLGPDPGQATFAVARYNHASPSLPTALPPLPVQGEPVSVWRKGPSELRALSLHRTATWESSSEDACFTSPDAASYDSEQGHCYRLTSTLVLSRLTESSEVLATVALDASIDRAQLITASGAEVLVVQAPPWWWPEAGTSANLVLARATDADTIEVSAPLELPGLQDRGGVLAMKLPLGWRILGGSGEVFALNEPLDAASFVSLPLPNGGCAFMLPSGDGAICASGEGLQWTEL
jgi:hypothetical protein